MKINLKSVLALLGFMAALPAQSAIMSGNELLASLKKKDLDGIRYITGVVDTVSITRGFFTMTPSVMPSQIAKDSATGLGEVWGCVPEGVSYGQVVDVTILYLEKNPAKRHVNAALLVAFALREAWPCFTEFQPSLKPGKSS